MTPAAVRSPRSGVVRHVPTLAVLTSSLLVLGPSLRPGYVLRYDMVFAPDPPVGRDAVGLGSQLPRAVPSDLVVALASHVLPGDTVQTLVLLGLLIAAGLGAARLAGGPATCRTAAALAYLWTPYVAERLLIGQWVVLVGWAVLPWLVHVARDGRVARWVAVAGLAVLGGVPAVLVAVPAGLVVAACRAGRRWWRALALRLLATAVLVLPFALPALLRPGGTAADATGAEVFAPRADSPLGRVGSLLTGGGIWNADAVPPVRNAVLPALLAVLLLVLGLAGAARRRDGFTVPLAAVAALGLGVASASAWPSGARAVDHLPEGALIRDSQRLLAPLVLLVAAGFGTGVEALRSRVPAGGAARAVALVALLPVAVAPSLAWAVSGRLVPVRYPAAVLHARDVVDGDPAPGGVLVLPAQPYRRFPWNGFRTALDPLPRLLHRPTVLVQDLTVEQRGRPVVVRGEDRLAARLRDATEAGTLPVAAAAAGIRYVLVDAPVPARQVAGLVPVFAAAPVAVYRVPGAPTPRASDPFGPYAAPAAPVFGGDVAALVTLLAAAAASAFPGRRRSPAPVLVSRAEPAGPAPTDRGPHASP